MGECIPFVTGEDTSKLVPRLYPEAEIVRVPLDRARNILRVLGTSRKVWLDPGVDGLHDLKGRQSQAEKKTNSWFELISACQNYDKIGTPPHTALPREIDTFVKELMEKCVKYKPDWITIPQLPLKGSDRNKINRALAAATARWKSTNGFIGKLILPLVFTHQSQVTGKTARNPRVEQAEKCYHDAAADGFWVVDSSLTDDNGSSLVRKRLTSIIDLHGELNDRISSKIRIAGPYWGLNLVLWARGLVDHPAIGIGSGYQFFMAGGQTSSAATRIAMSSLKRRVLVGPQLRAWLDSAIAAMDPTHPAYAELAEIKKQLPALSEYTRARMQIAESYKRWIDLIARAPKPGRSMAMYQDLSLAYAFGKSLPDLNEQGPGRRPEAVAEPLMMSCL